MNRIGQVLCAEETFREIEILSSHINTCLINSNPDAASRYIGNRKATVQMGEFFPPTPG